MADSSERTPEGELFTRLVLDVFHVNGRLLAAGDKLTEKQGLSSALWQVMGALRDGPLHMAQIARNMGLTRQSVRRTTYLLEKRGLVRFIANPDHQRAKLAELTEKGRSVLNKINRMWAEWSNRMAGDMRREDLETAVCLLRTITEKLEMSLQGETK